MVGSGPEIGFERIYSFRRRVRVTVGSEVEVHRTPDSPIFPV